jgi:hypothetical protein
VFSQDFPAWLVHIEEEDRQFVKRLVLTSGSLRQLAAEYGVSYPTIRLRLDRVIDRIRLVDELPSDDPFEVKIRLLVANGDVSAAVGKDLLRIHKEVRQGGRK